MESSNALVLTVLATDPDVLDTVVNYSLTSGADSTLFAITQFGELTFNSVPNFEMPFGADNVYNLEVNALDINNNILGSQSIVVTVVNANDLGSLSAISGVVREGEVLTASSTISDEDGSIDNERYQWLSDSNPIAGAVSFTYTLQSSDVGTAISVRVTYDDGFGTNNQLTSEATPLVSSSSANAVFNSSATVNHMENSNAVVLTVLATDPDPLDTVVDYNIVGVDSALFTINSAGELTFDLVPNFEFSSDDGDDNIYNLDVNALDSSDNILGSQSIAITVVDVNDIGSLSAISGVAREGQELTAGSVSDEDGSVDNERYQWFSDGSAIVGATNSTYTLTSSELGTTITVQVTYDDALGTDYQLTSDATLAVASSTLNATFTSPNTQNYFENSSDVVLKAIASDPDSIDTVVNYSVTGTDGSLFSITSDGDLTFDIAPNFEVSSDIGGDNVYNIIVNALDSLDIILGSQSIVITVINVNDLGSLSAITGIVREGQQLTAGDIADEDGSITNERYQWLSNGSAIVGATTSRYVLTSSEINTVISVRITYDDVLGNDHQLTSAETTVVSGATPNAVFSNSDSENYAENSSDVVLRVSATDNDDSDTVVGYSLTGTDSSLFNIASNGDLAFNTSPNFEIPSNDAGDNVYEIVVNALDIGNNILGSQSLTITVINANDLGSLSAITGIAHIGQELTAGDISDVDGSISNRRYQWFSDSNPIAGATNNTYVLQSSDVGTAITVQVTYDDGFGSDHQLTSGATATVTSATLDATFDSASSTSYAENSSNVVLQVMASDPDPSETVVNYSVTGIDGSLFSIASNGDLTFDSSPDFEMPEDDGRDSVYNIVVNALDGDGNTLGSQSIVITVTNANDIGSLSAISGTLREGELLTVGVLSDVDGSITSERYQWLSNGSAILGATNSTYTLVGADVGTAITVQVTYNDAVSTDNQITSAPTPLISDSSLNAVFTSPGTQSYAENSSDVVLTVVATDSDPLDTVVNYSVTGTDSSLFSIASNGDLTFDSSPNFEIPFGADNVYEIVVNALDVDGNTLGNQSITITVVDVNDIGTLSSISGVAREGQELTAGDISDEDGSVGNRRYQWLSGGSAIVGATNSSYTLQSSDVGTEVSVRVTYNDGFGSNHQLTSEETLAVISASLNAVFTSPDTAMYTENSNVVVLDVFAMDSDPTDIVANYELTGTDATLFNIDSSGVLTFDSSPNFEIPFGADNVYEIVVNALDSSDIILGRQSITITVMNANDIGTLSSISGVARQGQELTVGDISDEDGLITNERYQWFSNGSAIVGATNSAYTLTASEVGTEVSVRVTYNDGFGSNHQLTSEVTAIVSSSVPNAVFTNLDATTYMENSSNVVLEVEAMDSDPVDTVVGYSVTGTDSSFFSITSDGDLTF